MGISEFRPNLRSVLLDTVQNDHEILRDLFRRHQEALVGLDFAEALAVLDQFSRLMRRHMRLENEILIPAYEEVGEAAGGGKPLYLKEEHSKIEEQLELILTAARGWRAGRTERSEVLSLIERELRLKGLMDHHFEREETFLLPCLRLHVSDKPQKEEAPL